MHKCVIEPLSWETEQYCAAGAILKPLCLSKQLTLCSQQHIDQLFPGHIVQVFSLQRATLFALHNMFTVIIGFARERVKSGKLMLIGGLQNDRPLVSG